MIGCQFTGAGSFSAGALIRSAKVNFSGVGIFGAGPTLVINPDYALVAGDGPNLYRAKLSLGVVNLSMDMSGEIPPGTSILSVQTASGVIIGVDDDPEDILEGVPVRIGNIIVQRVKDGIAGNTYALSFILMMSDGQIIIAQGFLPISNFV